MNKHDGVILSGPKLFVEKFLTLIRDGKAFKLPTGRMFIVLEHLSFMAFLIDSQVNAIPQNYIYNNKKRIKFGCENK